MNLDYDVLVVGAGPSGSSAARACAKSGLKTLLIDKRQEIGCPVNCAEGISKYLFPFLPFKIPKEHLIWTTKGMEFWAEDITIRRMGVMWQCYTVNRKNFDKWLASLATNAGAKLMINTELVDFEFRDKYVVDKAVLRSDGKKVEVKPKVVISADGYDSTVLRLLGEYHPKKDAIGEIYSWEMHNMNLISPEFEQVFVGDFTDIGYAYVFPISRSKANVGVGCVNLKKPMEEYFKEFLEIPEMKRQVKNAVKIEDKGGKVNVLPITEKWIYGNIVLTGDAADQNLKPFVEGILPAIICGDIAGKNVGRYLEGGKGLENYEYEVKKMLGPLFAQSDSTRELVYELFDMKEPKEYLLLLLLMADVTAISRIYELEKANYNTLRDMILSWNTWHKQTIAGIQEYLWYKYVEMKSLVQKERG